MDIGIGGKSPFTCETMHNPGFMIRRLHQIYVALFADETMGLEITPVQLSVLRAISKQAGRDQSAIAEEIGVDRATLASVVARLESGGLIRRAVSRRDQRQKLLHLTAKGKAALTRMQAPMARANERILAPLDEAEQELFLSLLANLVDGGNEHARAKLKLQFGRDLSSGPS
ncbi:MarR family winged helix-turn-helix transcriptional regulator [Acidocella facilis]|uniref:MarR family winged helix-turn-helix transcriptional regulator n=1 Tax=Acidocella facilis TaxID=525 RepID=UPI001F260062|nr:MarR family transcriptional regulator [Acidocella facilis]